MNVYTTNGKYNNDIEMVMDFIRLSNLSNNNPSRLNEIFQVQNDLFNLFPTAVTPRMANVYQLLNPNIANQDMTTTSNIPVIATNPIISTTPFIPGASRFNGLTNNLTTYTTSNQIVDSSKRAVNSTLQMNNAIINSMNRNILNNDYYLLFFYRSSCPTCIMAINNWKLFKNNLSSNNFNILEYDINDPRSNPLCNKFRIHQCPSVLKLQLNNPNYMQLMQIPITVPNLVSFSTF